MACDPEPRPAHADWVKARSAGIDLPVPPAVLRPWRPGVADVDDWREPPALAAVGRDALVMGIAIPSRPRRRRSTAPP